MFKRFFTICICFIIVGTVCFINRAPIFERYSKTFQIYTADSVSSQIINVTTKEYRLLADIKGESIFLQVNNFDLQNFLSDFCACVVMVEHIEHGTSYYAYSPKIKYRTNVEDKVVNLHVFVSDVYVVAGAPIIYGSF